MTEKKTVNAFAVYESLNKDPIWKHGFYKDVIESRDENGTTPEESIQKVLEVVSAAEQILSDKLSMIREAQIELTQFDLLKKQGVEVYHPSSRSTVKLSEQFVTTYCKIAEVLDDRILEKILHWAYIECSDTKIRLDNGTPYAAEEKAAGGDANV